MLESLAIWKREDAGLKFSANDFTDRFEFIVGERMGLGMPPEDARMVLPEATSTKMFTTLNLRTLRELCEKRADNPGAQWEIRELVGEMRGRAKEVEDLRICVREMLN